MRHLAFALAILFVAATAAAHYPVVERSDVTLYAGQSTSIRAWTIGGFSNATYPLGPFRTTTPEIIAVSNQTETTREEHLVNNVTILALQSGTGYAVCNDIRITVRVLGCPTPVLIATPAIVAATVHKLTTLRVVVVDSVPGTVSWFVGGEVVPFATGDSLTFTPPAAGVFHVQARYYGVCGVATADIDVIAGERTRAVHR